MEQNNTNHFLGINWTVRFKNPQFWLAIALSILVPPLAYTGTEFNEVTSWGKFFDILGDGFANPYIVLMMLVGIYNAVVDKTTKGFGDSYIAKQYLRPRTDYDPKQALDWEVNIDKKAQLKDKIKKEQDEKLKLEEDERNKIEQSQKESVEMIEKEPKDDEAVDIVNDEPKPKNKMTDEEYDQHYTTQTKDDGLDDGKPLRTPVEYDESQPFTDDSEDVEFTTVDIADNTPQPKEQPAVDEWEDENEVKGSNPDDPKDIPEKPPEQDKEVDESKEVK